MMLLRFVHFHSNENEVRTGGHVENEVRTGGHVNTLSSRDGINEPFSIYL